MKSENSSQGVAHSFNLSVFEWESNNRCTEAFLIIDHLLCPKSHRRAVNDGHCRLVIIIIWVLNIKDPLRLQTSFSSQKRKLVKLRNSMPPTTIFLEYKFHRCRIVIRIFTLKFIDLRDVQFGFLRQ